MVCRGPCVPGRVGAFAIACGLIHEYQWAASAIKVVEPFRHACADLILAKVAHSKEALGAEH